MTCDEQSKVAINLLQCISIADVDGIGLNNSVRFNLRQGQVSDVWCTTSKNLQQLLNVADTTAS